MATAPADILHGMRRVYRRFERWRSEHSGVRLPIPEALWASAAEVAREHGVFHTTVNLISLIALDEGIISVASGRKNFTDAEVVLVPSGCGVVDFIHRSAEWLECTQ